MNIIFYRYQVISQILIPTDFSSAAWQATKLGVELARVNDATLNMLHIIPTVSRFSNDKHIQHLPEKLDQIGTQMDELSKELVNGWKVPVENFVLPGNVEDTMLRFIQERKYDLVIIGVNSHGTNNDLGSHANRVIERCSVPVLVVPNQVRSNGALAS